MFRPVAVGAVGALKEILLEAKPADKVIERAFKANRKWGSRDRREFAETVYDLVRGWRRYLWLSGIEWPADDRAPPMDSDGFWRVLGCYAAVREITIDGAPVIRVRDGLENQTRVIQESYPDWLDGWASEQVENWPEIATCLNQAAPVYLRANSLKASPEELRNRLNQRGVKVRIVDNDALVLEERHNVFATEEFQQGLFEVQDLHSQRIAPLLDPNPGSRVIDACAGAGGKTLHLAALMKNTGRIMALDVSGGKLSELQRRSRRAGCDIVEIMEIEMTKTIEQLEASCDRLLLDVPCSGIGVFRRNPDAKWRLSRERLDELKRIQADILDRYSTMVKPGGCFVYSTCSIARSENQGQIERFLQAKESQFRLDKEILLPPAAQGGDGFYAARILRH